MEAATKPVFLASRLFGVSPLVTKSVEALVPALFFATVLILVGGYLIVNFPKLEAITSIRRILMKFQIVAYTFTVLFCMVWARRTRKSMTRWVEAMAWVDVVMNKQGFQLQFNYYFYLGKLALKGLLISIAFTLNLLGGTGTKPFLGYLVSTYLTLAITNVVECQYNTLLHTIYVRFKFLTENLTRLEVQEESSMKSVHLEAMIMHYNVLVRECTRLNDCYGKQILLFVMTIFILTTANATICVTGLVSWVQLGSPIPSKTLMLAYAFLGFLRLFELWSIIKASDQVTEQAKDFTSSLYQLLLQEDEKLYKNKKLRLHLEIQNEPEFSACGFFPLDFTLLHSVIAAVTTYLVILIQFSNEAPDTHYIGSNSTIHSNVSNSS